MSEPPKLPAGDQRTWILEVDCFPLLRPGNVERKKECWRWRRFWVRRGSEIHMVWKGGGWINCMMEKSPASALTSASKCWEKNGDLHLFLHGEPSSQYLKQKSSKYREQDMGKEKEWNGRRKLWKEFQAERTYRTCANRTPLFYNFFEALDWRSIQFLDVKLGFYPKNGIISGLLFKMALGGVLLARIR